MLVNGFYTFAAAGRKVGRSRSRIKRLADEGTLITVYVDGRRYVRQDSLEAWARDATLKKLGLPVEEVRLNG